MMAGIDEVGHCAKDGGLLPGLTGDKQPPGFTAPPSPAV
ncbi:Uncharacterized protein ChrSV_1124 [Chromobacterium vaccinii]|nr:Uncharacterized protein ChrSW_1124 [Chromobacterium vaccinii]QND88582.1 Uncharacterized protein ChrSV_1124 [Chromobacterium vaccinii]